MKRKILPGWTCILWLCLIPYLCTAMINGAENALQKRKFDVEMILPMVIASQVSDYYEKDTIKAQAVISRSNIYRRKNREFVPELLLKIREKLYPACDMFRIPSYVFRRLPEIFETATVDTEGEVLTLNKELKVLPYHEISAGVTRNGKENLKSKRYTYLKSVESSVDKDAEKYLNRIYVSKEKIPPNLKISNRDRAGYVTELLSDGRRIEGETFRKGLDLPSSNFTMRTETEGTTFVCRGRGHGFGFSQYGGNSLAKDGFGYVEILVRYFPEMEISDIKETKTE